MTNTLALTPQEARIVLETASRELDTFPSLSQISSITLGMRNEAKSKQPQQPLPPAPKYPWPNSVIGAISGIDTPKGLSPFGLKFTGLTKDEAEFLYTCWKKEDWQNSWALEILGRLKSPGLVSDFFAKENNSTTHNR